MSDLKFEGKPIAECTKEELLQACESLFDNRKRAIQERDTYLDLIKSSFPIHKLWADFLAQLWASFGIMFFLYLILQLIKKVA